MWQYILFVVFIPICLVWLTSGKKSEMRRNSLYIFGASVLLLIFGGILYLIDPMMGSVFLSMGGAALGSGLLAFVVLSILPEKIFRG